MTDARKPPTIPGSCPMNPATDVTNAWMLAGAAMKNSTTAVTVPIRPVKTATTADTASTSVTRTATNTSPRNEAIGSNHTCASPTAANSSPNRSPRNSNAGNRYSLAVSAMLPKNAPTVSSTAACASIAPIASNFSASCPMPSAALAPKSAMVPRNPDSDSARPLAWNDCAISSTFCCASVGSAS